NTGEGFSATVFKHRETGEYTLAIRGTESDLNGIIQDVLRADIADIGGDGIAVSQALDLFNYYQDITAKQGQPVYHYQLVQERVPFPGHPLGLQLGGFGYISVTQVGVAAADGVLADKNFTVAGHSLGGHLALVMSRLDPSHVDAVYTYNAPGFDTGLIPANNNTELFFSKLAEAQTSSSGTTTINTTGFPEDKLNNLAVPLDVISDIGEMPGGQLFHFNEATGPAGIVASHLSKGITDAFAVYNLIADLDAEASLEQITNILKASAFRESESLESLTEALYILFENPYPAGFVGLRPQIDRETMYQYIQTLQANQNFQLAAQTGSVASLVGLGTSNLIAAAQNDTGVMYALQHLNPFAITGSTVIYDQHNTQGELDAANYSEEYLEDRAGFLIASMELALGNEGGPRFYYTDAITGETLLSGFLSPPANYDPQSVRQIRFGSTGNDNLDDLVEAA
ncbi:MAG TPA: hypothetical protein EYH06_01785, partial [Chromatiales bacterium]|nr:hypothetical protein [Chromatiales bacterium]